MKYLLDTNACIRFINGRAPKLRERFLAENDRDMAVSTVTKAEMFYGAAKSQTPTISRAKQDRFLRRFVSLPFDDAAADCYGHIRAALERRGTPISAYDMMIAAIALVHSLILVTHNVREFSRIEVLRLEDWEV
ncbi:MAG: type II toxin-antitoxin system VapC family toxin [Anaerolineae bacterium]|nr:type II toxin-antitoxin system VapC family toxin [Anaerolineae bacterium]